jgi:hypothetical protein
MTRGTTAKAGYLVLYAHSSSGQDGFRDKFAWYHKILSESKKQNYRAVWRVEE